MASEIKANKISPATGTDFTLGDSGDTFTVPSGATLSGAGSITVPSGGTLDVSSATMTGFTIPSGQTLTIDSGATIANNGTSSGFATNTPAFMAGCYDATGYYNFSNNVNTKVAFNTELLDTDSAYDSTTNYRFTVPTGKGGNYFISAGLQAYNSANITNGYLWIYTNGGAMGWSRVSTVSTAGFYLDQFICERIFPLNAGDYVEIRIQLDGTGSNFMLVDTASGFGRANWFCGWRLAT